jgi:hypothetical protein
MTVLGIIIYFVKRKRKANKVACYLLHAFLLGLFFDPKDGNMFLQYVGCLSADDMIQRSFLVTGYRLDYQRVRNEVLIG